MDYKYIEQLLERYWQCETSLEEEAILKTFFNQTHIPSHLMPYKPLFVSEKMWQDVKLGEDFDARIMAHIEKDEPVKARRITWVRRMMPLYKAAASVAIILTLGNAAQSSFRREATVENDYNYENYQDSYNDPEMAYNQISDALQMVSQSLSEASKQDSLLQVQPKETQKNNKMKRVLCLLLIACSIHVWGQDFASKFMEQCAKEDGDIQCQTVSPIMMEKLRDTMTAPDGDRDEEVPEYLLSKLKSARIITATKQSEKLFREAEQLIEKNKNRFSPLVENQPGQNNKVFVRKHDEVIRELVVLNLNPDEKTLTIVNLTGDMDDRFMKILSSGKLKQD